MTSTFPQALHYFDCRYDFSRRNGYAEDTLCEPREADLVRARLGRKAAQDRQELTIIVDARIELVQVRADHAVALYKGHDKERDADRFIVVERYPQGGWKVVEAAADESSARSAFLDG